MRKQFHCGWMEREEWVAEGTFPKQYGMGLITYTHDTCPGYLLMQPCVVEACEAAAVPDGEVGDYYPGGENAILQARLIAKGAQNLYQIHRMKTKEAR